MPTTGVKKHLPGAVVGFAVAGACAILAYCVCLRLGAFFYPLDDAYIHIAVAKNLALHGVWGIEPSAVAYCSSSPLWTLLLAAAYVLFGVNEFLPLILAIAFSAAVAYHANRLFAAVGMRTWGRLAAVFCVAAVTPLTATGVFGMEHSLHTLAVMAFLAGIVADAKTPWLCLWGFVATGVRFETLFVVLPVAVAAALVRQRPKAMAAVLFFSALPVLIYGWCAVANGGHFLPTSLLLKGNFPGFTGLFDRLWVAALDLLDPCLVHVAAMLAGLLFAACCHKADPLLRSLCLALVVATGGHLTFAHTGWRYLSRYEAYLMASAFATLTATLFSTHGDFTLCFAPRSPRVAKAVAVILALFLLRAVPEHCLCTTLSAIVAPDDTRCQQVQVAKIFNTLAEADKGPVLINDLGYFALHSGCPVVDLWGLGTQDIADLMIALKSSHRRLTDNHVQAIVERHGVRYAALYREWYGVDVMPDDMIDVAMLKLENIYSNGAETVALRARGMKNARTLKQHLENLPFRLPERARLTIVL